MRKCLRPVAKHLRIGRRRLYRTVVITDWHDEESGDYGSWMNYRYRQGKGRPVTRRYHSPAWVLYIYVSGSIYEEESARWEPAWWWRHKIQEMRRARGENPFARPLSRRHALQK